METHRTRVKICGVTRIEDALLACELGADAVGIVMTPSSPRCASIPRARAIRDVLPAFVAAVVVTADANLHEIEDIVSGVEPSLLQFHGHEDPAACGQAGVPYIKAFSMSDPQAPHPESMVDGYRGAAAILLDARIVGEPDKGSPFDWGRIPARLPRPLILAGGLDETNVASAIAAVMPYAVDVSSGVESAPGVKDRLKLAHFMAAVRRADRDRGT
ncbi:MAG: phosphoribosylanthranilate isomerase [Rhodanobacteraceae bacterium]